MPDTVVVGSVRSHLVSELITGRLRRRVRDRGSEPLITYYDLGSGERTELSGVSFANWVDKTSNLLVDELMIDPADQVELSLAATHPGHWVTLVWELACWQVGAVVTLGQPSSAQVLAAGPEPERISGQNAQVVICSLHPLGLGLPNHRPVGPWTTRWRSAASPTSTRPRPSPAWRWPGGTTSGS